MALLPMVRSLLERGVGYQMIAHDPAVTARDVATELPADIYDVLKSILVRTRDGYVVAVVRGVDKLDVHRVQIALGDPHARLATEEEIATTFPDLEPGCLPPVGAAIGIPTLVDPSVFGASDVLFSAGRQDLSIKAPAAEVFGEFSVSVRNIRKAHPWEDTDRFQPSRVTTGAS